MFNIIKNFIISLLISLCNYTYMNICYKVFTKKSYLHFKKFAFDLFVKAFHLRLLQSHIYNIKICYINIILKRNDQYKKI